MENASKALIMAAGVLIGMILLSLMVYMFISFGMTSAEVHKDNEQNRLNEFNSQFIAYEGMSRITIHDVVTVANLATETNIYYELSKQQAPNKNINYVSVKFSNSENDKMKSYNGYIENGYSTTTRQFK